MWLIACTSGTIELNKESLAATDSFEQSESPPDTDPLESIPNPSKEPESCSDLYDPNTIQAFDLEISDEEWQNLQDDYQRGQKNYHPATLNFENETWDVHIRLKGNPDFSWFTEKLQFVISFNETDPDARFHGVRKIALDASWYESTHMKDRIAWDIMQKLPEIPAACANGATLDINGEYYGLYTSIEYFDHEFLERVFGDDGATGGLYKYGTELTANDDTADDTRINTFWQARNLSQLEASGNVDQWVIAWAAEAVLGDDDGYWCCQHNFYLYDHPQQGILFLPWDMDDSFELIPSTTDPIEGYAAGQELGLFNQTAYQIVLDDPDYRQKYLDAVTRLNEALNPPQSLENLDTWDTTLQPLAERDPNRSYSLTEREQAVTRLKEWIPARSAYLSSWLACEQGSTTDADGDGFEVCQDADDSTERVSPAQAEVCGDGLDNDASGFVDDAPGCDCLMHGVDGREFLFCVAPRTATAAEANCAAQGGALGSIEQTSDYYLTYFYTWPHRDPWWVYDSNGASGGCTVWDPRQYDWATESCEQEFSSLCTL